MAKFFNEESVYENSVNPSNTNKEYVPNFVGAADASPTVSGDFTSINNEQPMYMVDNNNDSFDIENDTFASNEREQSSNEEVFDAPNTVQENPMELVSDTPSEQVQTGWNNNQLSIDNSQMVLDDSKEESITNPEEYYQENLAEDNYQEDSINDNTYSEESYQEEQNVSDSYEEPVQSEEEIVSDESILDDNSDSQVLEESNFVSAEEIDNQEVSLPEEEMEIKNPVYDASLDRNDREVSGNPLACFLVLIETFLFPSTSVLKNTEKYNKGKRVLKVYITIMIYLLIFSIAGHVIGGCFVNRFVESVAGYKNVFDFELLSKLNYFNIVILVLVESFGITLLFSIINYAMSFFSNKGVNFGSYLLLITLAFFPVLLYVSAIFPILKTISFYFTIVIFIILLLYSLLIYFLSIKNVMEFSNENRLIRYVLINVTIIIGASALLLYVFYGEQIDNFLKIFL